MIKKTIYYHFYNFLKLKQKIDWYTTQNHANRNLFRKRNSRVSPCYYRCIKTETPTHAIKRVVSRRSTHPLRALRPLYTFN